MKPSRRLSPHLLLSLLTAVVSGCGQQNIQPLEPKLVTIPQQWHAPQQTIALQQSWLSHFSAPQLETLITEALNHNHTIERTALKWKRAHQQSIIDRQKRQPTTEGKLSAGRSRTHTSGIHTHSSSHGLEFSTTWEADLWQRLSDQQQATLLREEASKIDLRAAHLSLVAELARNWFSAVEAKQQITLSQQRLEDYRSAEAIIENRYRNGLTDALDLHLARSEVAFAEERLLRQQMEQQQRLRTLEVLIGRYPAAQLEISDALPTLNNEIPAGLPASLLERRPDIHASQKRLQASGIEAEIAARNRLPSLSLTAKGGLSSSELNNLLDWDYLIWSLLGNLTQPLFQAEKLEAQARQEQIDQQQAAVDYAETVLKALQQVENHLAADQHYRQRSEAMARAAKESKQAAALALSRYQSGLVDILTLLDAQQRAYDRQSSHLQSIAARIDNRIQLHLALGGDY